MDMTSIFILITLIGAVSHIFLSKAPKTKNRVFEVFLLWFLFIMVGIGSIWAFVGHFFMSNTVAAAIGWPAGNPFQLEVGLLSAQLHRNRLGECPSEEQLNLTHRRR